MNQTQTGAELPHLDGVEHRFIDLPGLRMHVAEAGSGEPVVLLHGFPQHWWEWRDVIPGLAEQYRGDLPRPAGRAGPMRHPAATPATSSSPMSSLCWMRSGSLGCG